MRQCISDSLSHKFMNMSFVCALLVVFIHVYVDYSASAEVLRRFLSDSFCQIAVPFFFVAAGFFLFGHVREKGWWGPEVRKRVWSLAIPYFLWSFVYFLYALPFILAANWLAHASWTRNIPDIAVIFGLDQTCNPLLGPLWFVRTLFVFVLGSWLLAIPIRKSRFCAITTLGVLLVAYVVTTLTLGETEGKISFCLGSSGLFSLKSLFYFSAGCYLRQWPIHWAPSRKVAFASLALGIALCVAHTALLLSDGVTSPQLRHLVKMALIPVTGYGVWLLIPERKWPSWLTGTAFPIFLLHSFIFVFIDRFTHTFAGLGALEGSLPGFLLKGLLGIVGAIGVTLILRRYLPRCASILFGGRG